MNVNTGGVYTVYNKRLERYTAYRAIYIMPSGNVSNQSWVVILSLSWVGDVLLIAEELPHLHPLYKDFMYWLREFRLLRVSVEIPPQHTLVDILPSFADEPCHSYGHWDDGYEVYRQVK